MSKILKHEMIEYIIVHCSDTTNNFTVEEIHEMHLNFGWDGIGYHKIIDKKGKIHNGRPEYWIGAHVKGLNARSLSVCLIGKKNFLKAQFISLKKVITDWKKKCPNAKVIGHRDAVVTKKTCPNFDVTQWYRKNFQNNNL